ncbi:MAG: hypothetical protein KW793_03020 [Candidatus Doudnabacteria bacterium]|nr:hypothetical protein [Candidatus Doudnabacteria bacterium]
MAPVLQLRRHQHQHLSQHLLLHRALHRVRTPTPVPPPPPAAPTDSDDSATDVPEDLDVTLVSNNSGGGGGGGNHSENPFKDGTLLKDDESIYVVEHGLIRPISSMLVFDGFGYILTNVIPADISDLEEGNDLITSEQRHVRGTLVENNGIVYFLGKDVKYAFPSRDVFLSWGSQFKDIVPANSLDLSLPDGPVVEPGIPALSSSTDVTIGSVIKAASSTVYEVLTNALIRPFTSAEEFLAKGFKFSQIKNVLEEQLKKYQVVEP